MAVFGSSSTVSIQRGYFHGPAAAFTCACSAATSALRAGLQHDEGHRLHQPVGVLAPDHRRFLHGVVGDQRGLDLEGADPDAADLEHVVGAALVAVEALGIAEVLVAGARPFALEGAARLRALVPVALGGGRAADQQLAGLAIRRRRGRARPRCGARSPARRRRNCRSGSGRGGWRRRCAASPCLSGASTARI